MDTREQKEWSELKSELRQEFGALSHEFDDTMSDYQGLVRRHNHLIEIAQYILREVEILDVVQQDQIILEETPRQWQVYYEKVGKTIEMCQVLGETVSKGNSLNEMIGHYLIAAKQEAAAIIANAHNQVKFGINKNQADLESKYAVQQKQLISYKKELADLRHKTHDTPPITSEEAREAELLREIDDYSKKVKADADRYSRQRKLMADDQVTTAKREIEAYADKREKDLKELEIRLEKVSRQLHQRFDSQLDGTLESILAYFESTNLNIV